jgi:transcriptional regulator GlxA family with amidase domain
MEELKGITPAVLDLSVISEGDEELGPREVNNGRDIMGKPSIQDSLTGTGTESEPKLLPGNITNGQHHRIQKAVSFVNDNYRTDISRDAACGLACMSPAHFSRTFRKVVGMSYQEYVNRKRIEKAKELLRTSPQSIAEIAAYVGFADNTGFGRIFKKVTGHTPSAYRKGS